MIYLDNPATSWPKPSCMMEAMSEFSNTAGGNPGRSGHRLSTEAGRIVFNARESIASLFGSSNPEYVVFTMNATMALNMAMLSLLEPGDMALTTSCEHNSIMRPLRHLESKGVTLSIARANRDGSIDLDDFEQKARKRPNLVIAAHAGNVTGYVAPIVEMAKIARDNNAMFLLDAAQTAGTIELSEISLMVDIIAFTGHKGLMGPQGTGGLFASSSEARKGLKPIIFGGTGSRSAFENQPDELPDRLEAGTVNGIGIAGLGETTRWLQHKGIKRVSDYLDVLTEKLNDGLRKIEGITVYGPEKRQSGSHLLSFTHELLSPSEIGIRLDEHFGIMGRMGLHCSPSSHKVMGTFPKGAVRFGLGPFNTQLDITRTIDAVREISEDAR